MDIYYEQSVTNNNIDARTKKTKAFVIAQTACLIIGLFILVSSALMIEVFWVFIIFSLPLFVAAFILSRINRNNNVEYDYVLDDEAIKVTAVYFRERRKPKYTVRLRLIESVGVFDSEGYKKIERLSVKNQLALVNYDDEKAIMYILYNTEKGKKMLFIEPDRGFITALRRSLASGALTVFDKSISDLEKYLTEKERLLAAAKKDDELDEISDDDDEETHAAPDDDEAKIGDTDTITDGDPQ